MSAKAKSTKQPKCIVVGCRERRHPSVRGWCEAHWTKWLGSHEAKAVAAVLHAADGLADVSSRAREIARRPLVDLAYRSFTRRMAAEARR